MRHAFVFFYVLLLFQSHLFATLARPLDKTQEQQEQQHQDVLARRSGAGCRAGDLEDRGEPGRLLCANFFIRAKSGRGPGEVAKKLAILAMAFV